MKTNDFISNLQEKINNKRNIISGIKEDIAKTEAEIRELSDQIDKYTDADNVKGYSDLKDNREIREHKLELLKKNLQAELMSQDESEISTILFNIMTEKRALDEKYGAEMLEIILKLKEKYDEADAHKMKIERLYEDYMTVFNVPRYRYQSYEGADSSGIAPNVARLINALRGLNKI